MNNYKVDMPDFEKADHDHRFMDRKMKLSLARRLGYSYITQAIYMLYYADGYTIRGLSEIMGFSPSAIMNLFKSMGWAAHPRGGAGNKAKLYPHIVPILQAWYAVKRKTSAEHTMFYTEQGALYRIHPLTVRSLIVWKSWAKQHTAFLKGEHLPIPQEEGVIPELTLEAVQEMRRNHLARIARAGDDTENGPGKFYPIDWDTYGQLLNIALDVLRDKEVLNVGK